MFKIAGLFEYVAENELVVVIVVHGADGCGALSAGVGVSGACRLAPKGIVGACGRGHLNLSLTPQVLAPGTRPGSTVLTATFNQGSILVSLTFSLSCFWIGNAIAFASLVLHPADFLVLAVVRRITFYTPFRSRLRLETASTQDIRRSVSTSR
ncbi:hypothetical protein GY45DRAFT_1083623 [Cubamyces sp. BRFM 1775]|nr:hypothetical protein GY45DRAFT_1083623 [Cubamyces sp. BRFM 1775]